MERTITATGSRRVPTVRPSDRKGPRRAKLSSLRAPGAGHHLAKPALELIRARIPILGTGDRFSRLGLPRPATVERPDECLAPSVHAVGRDRKRPRLNSSYYWDSR